MTMLNALERKLGAAEAAERLAEMLLLGLTGLGASESRARAVAAAVSARLKQPHSSPISACPPACNPPPRG
jgi:F0F1-type ATP synthase membrane subunit c/vacuolar-type H+-ATPase subunit K